MNKMFYVEQSHFGEVPRNCSFSMGFRSGEGGEHQDNTVEDGVQMTNCQQDQQSSFDIESLYDLYCDIFSPASQSCQDDIVKLSAIQSEILELIVPREKPHVFPSASLEILKNFGSRIRRLTGEKINVSINGTPCTKASSQNLSTVVILQLAVEKFIQYFARGAHDPSMLGHPFSNSSMREGENRDAELLQCLLASAEKLGQNQFDCASKLLCRCFVQSSEKGNTVRRLVYYFSKALQEKIDRATTGIMPKELGKKSSTDLDEELMSPCSAIIALHQNVPFPQLIQFTAIQAIVENVAGARKIHVIDLEIRTGIQCTVLMQALTTRHGCPVEHLKITAFGTKSKSTIEQTGKRLICFAESMKLPFSFNVVMVEDMLDLSHDIFCLDPEESVAVYSSYMLKSMIAWPDRLNCLMRVIRDIKPCVMVVSEIEGNHNASVFLNRFIEVLLFYGAYMDSVKDCMDHDETNRTILESKYFCPAIQNIVAADGEERTIRHVSINVWRVFFARFGMLEIDLSMSSLYQASLLLNNFTCGSSCTLEMDGKSLIIGWKGTTLHSLSAWKFL